METLHFPSHKAPMQISSEQSVVRLLNANNIGRGLSPSLKMLADTPLGLPKASYFIEYGWPRHTPIEAQAIELDEETTVDALFVIAAQKFEEVFGWHQAQELERPMVHDQMLVHSHPGHSAPYAVAAPYFLKFSIDLDKKLIVVQMHN